MGLLAQHRGGACFCTRDGVLDFSFRYKFFGIGKNRDTKCECPRQRASLCRYYKIVVVVTKFSRHRSQ